MSGPFDRQDRRGSEAQSNTREEQNPESGDRCPLVAGRSGGKAWGPGRAAPSWLPRTHPLPLDRRPQRPDWEAQG